MKWHQSIHLCLVSHEELFSKLWENSYIPRIKRVTFYCHRNTTCVRYYPQRHFVLIFSVPSSVILQYFLNYSVYLLHVPSSNWRQRASRKSVTGLNSHMIGRPAYHLPISPFSAASASSSSMNCFQSKLRKNNIASVIIEELLQWKKKKKKGKHGNWSDKAMFISCSLRSRVRH